VTYRVRLKAALDSIDATTSMPEEWRPNNHLLLEQNIAFIDKCLADGVISLAASASRAAPRGPRWWDTHSENAREMAHEKCPTSLLVG
jgi:hypothetical protein